MNSTRIFAAALCLFCLLSSCKINQRKNGEKVGHWIYKDTFMGSTSESKGRYKKDFEVGKWRHYVGEKLFSKRVYKDSICYTTDYHKNGVIRSFGISKMILEEGNLHWFLSGEWKFYDSEGVLLGTKIYEKGEPTFETYTN
jgi:antitoxin component YwqK of YwqJK toxin-antitoxin module